MRIRFKKANLIQPTSIVNSVAPQVSPTPVLCNVLIRTEHDNMVSLVAADYETRVRVEVIADVEEHGSVLIPAKTFSDLVKELPEDSELTLETSVGSAFITASGVKAKLPTHYYIDDAEDGLELPSIVLLEQLRTVDKRRLGNFIGHLSEKHICGINHALAVSIGLIESVPKKLILCLCSTCADNFYGTGAYYLRRIDPVQVAKDTCTYCNQRKGYDYELVPKKR